MTQNQQPTPAPTNRSKPQASRHEALLDKLAETAVRTGLNVAPGQQVVITAPLEALALVRRVTEHAYKAGASLVSTLYRDDEAILARYRHASESTFDVAADWLGHGMAEAFSQGAARLAITGGNPTLLAGVDPARIARATRAQAKATRKAMELITRFAVNWNIIACATPAWAAQVFPNLPPQKALEALWEGIFSASRVTGADPVEEWAQHNAALHARARALNEARWDSLHFTGPGTDLVVGLADGHFWSGGSEKAGNGVICNANIPTEEVFTTPHATRVEGTVSSTKPLFHNGALIDGITVRFKGGMVVEAHAAKGEAVLQRLLDSDQGARRIGEVALVPHSSPIAQSGILYRNTLFDENAASHIALGQSYAKCMVDAEGQTEVELTARGANQSAIHVDWMIGSGDIDVDATKDGQSHPLMRKGEWVNKV
ncbi:aminopeptidase [Formicincola oecophyllae]|uniref:Aminopeptidase n=1 Tax=Formicincola oecophyllae TaxID=2558361 RepID=A0A4Y6UBD9_9PROT|nr:aminopeptidase [Formicincola oecophyllae]QDH13786.1 aminopeptidase [Formicincola oecophyllae]